MQRLRVEKIVDGPHSSELIVGISTKRDGSIVKEEMIIDRSVLNADDTVNVASPLARRNGSLVLVELPRETMRGAWRVWVDSDQLQ